MRGFYFIWPLALGLALLIGACNDTSNAAGDAHIVADEIQIDLDKSNPERLLDYYFGGYAAKAGRDPFEAGLLIERQGNYYLNAEVLSEKHAEVGVALQAAHEQRTMDWEALSSFLNETYYDVRALPYTLAELRQEVPYLDEDHSWFRVEIDGVMTAATRTVYVAKDALRAALRGYFEQEEQLIYPAGTTFIGEHHLDGVLAETTVMRKREDGYWDFFTYDESGSLAPATATPPRNLKTPTQCVGCHFGSKLFEPERSFPGKAPPGPNGPRAINVGQNLRDAEVVRFFQEHSKRSDTVLGIYNTLFVTQLRAQRQAGTISDEDTQLLKQLGL